MLLCNELVVLNYASKWCGRSFVTVWVTTVVISKLLKYYFNNFEMTTAVYTQLQKLYIYTVYMYINKYIHSIYAYLYIYVHILDILVLYILYINCPYAAFEPSCLVVAHWAGNVGKMWKCLLPWQQGSSTVSTIPIKKDGWQRRSGGVAWHAERGHWGPLNSTVGRKGVKREQNLQAEEADLSSVWVRFTHETCVKAGFKSYRNHAGAFFFPPLILLYLTLVAWRCCARGGSHIQQLQGAFHSAENSKLPLASAALHRLSRNNRVEVAVTNWTEKFFVSYETFFFETVILFMLFASVWFEGQTNAWINCKCIHIHMINHW